MIAQTLEKKLRDALNPVHLEIINESYMHRAGDNSHFKVIIVSEAFNGLRLLPRHRLVNQALAHELKYDIHALAMHTYTQEEWKTLENVPKTPSCVGHTDN